LAVQNSSHPGRRGESKPQKRAERAKPDLTLKEAERAKPDLTLKEAERAKPDLTYTRSGVSCFEGDEETERRAAHARGKVSKHSTPLNSKGQFEPDH
jgi:hypothetical protein